MTRLNWLLLGLGVLLMLLSSRDWRLPASSDELPAELAEEPDLYMEDAVIDEYDADGALRYRLTARRVANYPDRGLTTVERPVLQLARQPGAPWQARAGRGRMQYGDNAPGGRDTITLEAGVVLERDNGDGSFVRLTTDELVIEPDARRAHTDKGVKIVTEAGHTTADRMEGELDGGRLRLFSNGKGRVITVVEARADS